MIKLKASVIKYWFNFYQH